MFIVLALILAKKIFARTLPAFAFKTTEDTYWCILYIVESTCNIIGDDRFQFRGDITAFRYRG